MLEGLWPGDHTHVFWDCPNWSRYWQNIQNDIFIYANKEYDTIYMWQIWNSCMYTYIHFPLFIDHLFLFFLGLRMFVTIDLQYIFWLLWLFFLLWKPKVDRSFKHLCMSCVCGHYDCTVQPLLIWWKGIKRSKKKNELIDCLTQSPKWQLHNVCLFRPTVQTSTTIRSQVMLTGKG